MEIEFVASFSPIVSDVAGARRFYGEILGIHFEGGGGGTDAEGSGDEADGAVADHGGVGGGDGTDRDGADAESYAYTERLDGVKHLGLWPLDEAAEACFGAATWPDDVPRPQASIEFEVADVAAATRELEAAGQRLLHGPRTEPWGQTVARLLSADGLLIAISHTPHLREGRHLREVT